MSQRKVIFFSHLDWYLFNFRLPLAKALQSEGFDVVFAAPEEEYAQKIEESGFKFIPVNFRASSKGVDNLFVKKKIKRIYRSENADVVHHFGIKAVLFGGMAAKELGIPMVNAISGLGHLFTDNSLLNRFLRRIVLYKYKKVLGLPLSHSIFQNHSDSDYFQELELTNHLNSSVIRGSGVNCELFKPTAFHRKGPCRVLFASRLIREKGIVELIEATNILRNKGVELELLIAGRIYPNNPSSLTTQDVRALESKATFLGHLEQPQLIEVLHSADIVVLPSYAEGTPRILLEAGAAGKAMIATDIAGCRGVVISEKNGILVPVKNAKKLADAVERLIQDEELRLRFGDASRTITVEEFGEAQVHERTIAIYRKLLAK